MKKLLFICLLTFAVTSCKKEEQPDTLGKLMEVNYEVFSRSGNFDFNYYTSVGIDGELNKETYHQNSLTKVVKVKEGHFEQHFTQAISAPSPIVDSLHITATCNGKTYNIAGGGRWTAGVVTLNVSKNDLR